MDKEKPPVTLTAFDWGNAGNFLGVCTYAYESIGSIFNGNLIWLNLSEKNNEGQNQDAKTSCDRICSHHCLFAALFNFILSGMFLQLALISARQEEMKALRKAASITMTIRGRFSTF